VRPGVVRKVIQTVYDHQGRTFDVLECNHALYQRYKWVKSTFRKCPVCGVERREAVPELRLIEVLAIDNAKEALLEGKRRLALDYLKANGKEPPPILLKPRYSRPLFEVPVMPTQKVHYREKPCGISHGKEPLYTNVVEEVTCVRCLLNMRLIGVHTSKKVHYQDCDGQRLCVDNPTVRSDFPLLTTDIAEVSCTLCLERSWRE